MSNYNYTETDDDISRPSNKTTDNNYTKISLDQDFSDDDCILEGKSPKSIRETVNGDTEVLHTFVDFNPLKQNSVKVPGTSVYTNKSCESLLSLNVDCNKPVKSYKNSNAVLKPFIVDDFFQSLDKRNEKSLDHKNCDSNVQPSYSTKCNESVIKYCEQNKYATINLSAKDPRLKNYRKNKYEQRFINFKGLKQLRYNTKPYLNKNLKKINSKSKNMNSSYNVGVSNNSDSFSKFNEQNIEGIKEFHVNENDMGAKGCINYNKVMKQVNTEQNKKNKNVPPLIDLNNDGAEVVNYINSYDPFKNYCELKNDIEVSLEPEEKKLKYVVENIIDNLDDSITLDSNCSERMVSQKNQEIITTHNLNERIKNNVKTVNNNFLTLENSSFDNKQQTAGVNISELIETNKNSKQIRSIEHSTAKSIEKHIDLTNGRNVTDDLNENLNFNTSLITKKLENLKRMSMDNVSKDEDKFNQRSKNLKRINNDDNSVINQHEKSKKSKKSRNNKHKNKSPKHNKSSKIHKNKYSSKIDSKVLKMSDLVTIDTKSNDEQVNNEKLAKKLVKKIMKTNKNEVRNDPDKIIQLENKVNNIDKNHVENASELIENNQCRFDSIEIVFNEQRVEVESNSNIFTESVSLVTNVSKKTHSLKSNTVQSLPNYEYPVYDILSDVVEEEQHIKCSKQILNKNPEIQNANESCHGVYEELSILENSGDSKDKKNSATVLQDTTTDETISNEPFKNATIFSMDYFIDNGKPNDDNVGYETDESENIVFVDYISNKNCEKCDISEINKENQDTEINELLDVGSNFHSLSDDAQSVSKGVETDYLYSLIKINNSLFYVNLNNENDIFNFIQLYSRKTQTSWRVMKSCKTSKYNIWKIFGCLHNSLYEIFKNPGKEINLNESECPSVIDIRIKYLNSGEKNNDPYLKNGFPAIVKLKNNHNHSVCKAKDLLLSTTETAFQANNIGIRPYFDKLVVDTSNSSDTVVENNNINISTQNIDHISFSKWHDIKILSYVVESKHDVRLKSGQQIINNGKPVNHKPYHFVDTSYCKKYFRKLKFMLSNDVKSKWLGDKKTTLADQVSLYKCSGKNCKRVFRNQQLFRNHLNYQHHSSNLESPHFMKCMYCFKQFDNESISELGKHIMENYTFCKYFCRYCLYRAYTASHVLVHEYVFHKDQKPSIIKFKNRPGGRKEVVMVVDFNKFVLRYVCNIGCCTFSTYINTDFLSHLILKHALCDDFYCNLCSNNNDNEYVCSNPELFVKHFSLHNINTYQCIFCLFGAKNINVMLFHLAMEHFEYEPLCLERCLKSEFCDNRNIKNLKILNIQKYVTDKIIEVLVPAKNGELQECPTKEMNEKCKIDETEESEESEEIDKLEEIDEVDNTHQVLKKIFKKIAQPSKNKSTVVVDNENDIIILSDEAENNQRNTQPIKNVKASIVNDTKNKSQLSNYDLINNFELENDIEIQINKKHLETKSSEKPTVQSKNYGNDKLDNQTATMDKLISNKAIDEVFPDGLSYEDHLNNCPLESPKECTFCLAQSKATFEVVNLPKLVEPNRFTCTFCNLKLPSVAITKHHVRKEHHILNFEFVPVDINSNNIKEDRFLVCQYKSLKRKKLFNDCILLTESDESTTTISKKNSDVVNKHNDFQLTKSPNALYNSKQNTRRSRGESKEQHKVLKRKHSTESCNNTGNKKKPSNSHRSNDTMMDTESVLYFYPGNIDNIPQTEYSLQPIGCLLCNYETNVRSNLVSHLKKHRVEADDSNKSVHKSNTYDLNSIFTPIDMINSSTSLSKAQENEKIKSIEKNRDILITPSTNKAPQFFNHPKFVPKKKRYKCLSLNCDFTGPNIKILKLHLSKSHQNISFYVCPHCKPLEFMASSEYEMLLHLNYHGANLYTCHFCSYIHYKSEKLEEHQRIKHPSHVEGENKLNIVTISKQTPIKKPILPDKQIVEWKCKLCDLDVKYTIAELTKHLSTVHNISNMFHCTMCFYDHSDYHVLEKHFKLNHPSLSKKYLKHAFDKVSLNAELHSANKQKSVDKHVPSTPYNTLNILEALASVAEPSITVSGFKELPSANKQPNVDEHVPNTQYNTLNVPESLSSAVKSSTTITGFKELPPVKHKNVDKHIPSTQNSMFNIPEALASVAKPSITVSGFKELPLANKQPNVDEHVPNTQYNTLNVPESLSSAVKSSTTITRFKELPPVKHTNVDKHVPSTQNIMFNIPEALDSIAELLVTIARFKELLPANKQTNMDEQVPNTQYNTLNVPETLANVSKPSTTIARFKELPPVKQTDVDENVPSTQNSMFNISNALARVAESSTKIAEFKDLQPTNKQANVHQPITSTQNSMFNIPEALDSVAELLATIARFKKLPPVKEINVDEHVPSTQYNTLNVPEALASISEPPTTIAEFKELQPTNMQKNIDQHIPSTQNSMFNIPEALDSVAELLTTIARFKELQPTNKQKNVDQHIPSIQNSMFNFPEALDSVTELIFTIAGFKEIPIKSTTICSTSSKSIDVLVSEVQEKIFNYPSRNPNGYLTLIRCIGKYACPVCNVFITEKEQSFHEHLLKEINGEIWKCLKCFAISDSVEKMESHVIKHTFDKRNYEKIEFYNKNIWVDRIIEYQNILIEYVRLKRNN